MRIVINGRFLLHQVTGVERFAREITAELDKIIEPGNIIMAVPPGVEDIPFYQNIKVIKVGKFHNRLWEHISFPYYVHKLKATSLNLCNAAPLVSPGIVCIHDVKIKAKPHYYNKLFILWYNLLLKNATKRGKSIITVSEFSKREICKYYHVDSEKIFVVYNGWQHYKRISFDENALQKYGLKKGRYFFSMCSLEPNKNFRWIAEEAKLNQDMIFAVAGSINSNVFADGFGFKCPKNMKFLGYVSDEEAKTLMRDCNAFLFPTFYEGFGIPPLEAISVGAKQVVVSDTEVMHEIFGNQVVYIDPNEYDAKTLSNINEVDNLNILEILKKFDWRQSAQILWNILKRTSERK